MSYEAENAAKQLNINLSVAVNVTAEMAAAATRSLDLVDPVEYFLENLDAVAEAVLGLQARKLLETQLGATVVPQGPVPAPVQFSPLVAVAQAQAPSFTVETVPAAPYHAQASQTQAPAPIPGAADGNPLISALWSEFFSNPGNWYNNIGSKQNPAAPDFRHKTKVDEKGRKVGLWVNDKQNPSWVRQNLVAAGLVA